MFPIIPANSVAEEAGNSEGIFGFGRIAPSVYSITNLVSNAGVVATDDAGVGTARTALAACSYGGDKGIFGYGNTPGQHSMTNLISNAGVVATDVTGVGTARSSIAACSYGGDKGIFGFGYLPAPTDGGTAITNKVSDAGVVASDTAAVGTGRHYLAACSFN